MKKRALVIVESPTKVKKIGQMLGSDFIVKSSMGHIRDLPSKAAEVPENIKKEPWSQLGVNTLDGFSPVYVISAGKKKIVKELKDAMKQVDELVIATDADREGESIGWHLVDILKPKSAPKRMVFTEITKKAVQDALNNMKTINYQLVEAQETRRILDRLYGYTLSPLLWKKIQYGLSAGRVQSVAVRVIVEREIERMEFKKGFFCGVKALVYHEDKGQLIESTLSRYKKQRVATGKDFDEKTGGLKSDEHIVLLDEKTASEIAETVLKAKWQVTQIEENEKNRKPYAPFTTSTLQQEANRKFRFSARRTMQVAQSLYENGYITYMRTDSVYLSDEAIQATRKKIADLYGENYLSPQVRVFANKSKNAQEAHEAIRPAGSEMKTAEELLLNGDDFKLYSLIWKRTMAAQMAEARLLFQNVTFEATADYEFKASGKRVLFPGFFRAYVEDLDDPEAALEDQEKVLPPLKVGAAVTCEQSEPTSHETKPPARYTQATLVKQLEADGIGRPSTYASIISTIQDRGYIKENNNQLIPTFMAFAVTKLLMQHFPKLVDSKFTAEMETVLDQIAGGEAEKLPYLKSFYSGVDGVKTVVDQKEGSIDAKEACTLSFPSLMTPIRIGKYGPFVEKEGEGDTKISVSIPDSVAPADLNNETINSLVDLKKGANEPIGIHPETQKPVFLLVGPYGPYVQMGEAEGKNKPKRVSLPKNLKLEDVDFDKAVKLLNIPYVIGKHPETEENMKVGIGRFGPYIEMGGKFKSIPVSFDVLNVSFEDALTILSLEKKKGGRKTQAPLKILGKDPETSEDIELRDGRYGLYLKVGKLNAKVPKETNPETLTFDEAVAIIKAKRG